MSLFGKSEYARQLETSARQQAEYEKRSLITQAQQEETQRQQLICQQQADEQQRQLEISKRSQVENEQRSQAWAAEHERQIAEFDAQMERTRQREDRYTKLLDVWENQARRFDAILTNWEHEPKPGTTP